MQTLTSTLFALLSLTSAAIAADLGGSSSTNETRYAAPPIVEDTVPAWNGLYIGVHGGYLNGNFDDAELQADVYNKGVDFEDPIRDYKSESWLAGVHVGANRQLGNFVFGFNTGVSFTDFSDRQDFDFKYRKSVTGDASVSANFNWIADLKGRTGYAFSDIFMAYATGGIAFTKPEFRGVATIDGGDTVISGRDDSLVTGFVVGAGAEVKLTEKVSFGVEYLHYDFGDENFSSGLSGFEDPASAQIRDADLTVDTVKGSLNYRF